MNLRVAIQASTSKQETVRVRVRTGISNTTLVAGRLVTLVTQERGTLLQEIVIDATVRRMTDRAVLGHRLVAANERAALFHVAGVAGLVDGISGQLLFT